MARRSRRLMAASTQETAVVARTDDTQPGVFENGTTVSELQTDSIDQVPIESFRTTISQFSHTDDLDAGTVPTKNPLKRKAVVESTTGRATRTKREIKVTTTITQTKVRKASSKKSKRSDPQPDLPGVPDAVDDNLLVLLIGHNPGLLTSSRGHAYSHPSNRFWHLLHVSGLTDRKVSPEEDGDLPRLYSLGLTNIVARPTRDTAALSSAEQVAGAGVLDEKVKRWRPEVVCVVGKSIWEHMWTWKYQRKIKPSEFKYGWQEEEHNWGVEDGWPGAKVFVATTTSGLFGGMKMEEKVAIWKPLGEWAATRRVERKAAEEVQNVDTEA